MAFMAVLESDLRALSAEARRRHPAVKDAAEHAILKLRTLSSPGEIALNEDILRIFLMACEVKSVKLSVIGLSCLQKLISHDAVAPSALRAILLTLKDHAEMADESVQLKTLQTILIIFQSHLLPENEDNLARALGICLRLLEHNRSSDSVHNTAAATFRQAVALIFDNVVRAESLPIGKMSFGNHLSRASSVIDDVSRSIRNSKSLEGDIVSGGPSSLRETPTKAGRLGLRLLEDLTALAAGGSATWLRVNSLQRIFALDILEFILSNYVSVFRTLIPYEQVLRHQICSLLMTSLRTNVDPEGEAGEPSFRRLVLRSVAHIIRLYSSTLVTESEVFLNMLVKVTSLDLPLWHRILVLEVLRGFCVEVRTLRVLFQNFDMNPKNTNVVENMVRALARVVSTIQVPDTNEESLAAVAGMFSSKAKGVEWSLDNDASNAAVVVASEAHAITLAVEGLLGVVFTVATLTDEAVDVGELESPRCDDNPPEKCTGKTATLCLSMVDSMWLTILDALSLILSRSQGEAIILEILKGYQAFTQACGVLRAVEPLNSFLASLCKFTISIPNEAEKKSALQSPGSKRTETSVDQRDSIVLTSKNVQALRTLFNIAHRLHNMLGPSWVLVLETLSALDRAIRSPHASTQEVSTAVPKLTREASGQYSDLNILSSLNSQLFESSALMHITAVKSLLSALHQLSCQCASGPSSSGQTSSQQIGSVSFAVERMTSILVNNLHRVEPLWDQVVGHLLELADNPSPQLRNMALDALDQCICAVLGSDRFQSSMLSRHELDEYQIGSSDTELQSFEHDIISPLTVLYMSTQNLDVRVGSLKILLHVLERHGEKLYYSWPNILEMLRSVANVREKDLIPLGFQCVRIIMNDGLSTIPMECLDLCIEVTGAYSQQKTDINISLTAVSLLWTATDFIAKGLVDMHDENETEVKHRNNVKQNELGEDVEDELTRRSTTGILLPLKNAIDYEKLLFSVFSMLQTLGADERPEVRNSAIRTLFQTLGSHGQKLSSRMWEKCLANYVFPILDHVTHLAANSSRDEWQGKELGTRGGKSVHMLIHHSRNTAQKQWDETLVLVLGGITRLLRSFFPLLQKLSNFWAGWESLLRFVGNSISNGSKEVAFAAINCLQTTIASQCPKGTLPVRYLKSMLGVYELVLQRPAKYVGSASNKVKQDILHSIGDLYVQGQMMFDEDMYLQLLAILHLAVRHSYSLNDNIEAEFGTVTPVQHTILKITPLLRPSEHLSSMWSRFLEELLGYLPGYEIPLHEEVELKQANAVNHNLKGAEAASNNITSSLSKGHLVKDSSILLHEAQIINSNSPNNSSSSATRNVTVSCLLFGEKLVPILVDLFLAAPEMEKYTVYPDIIRRIGRCMCTRRDNPNGSIWRSAVEGFNHVLIDDLSRTDFQMDNLNRSSRTRLWKEVADAYETFLVSSCGHPSQALSAEVLKADESLEMEVLHILCDKLLKAQIDAPTDILQRLVTTLDRCASRTGSLPVETVGMLPLHCSRFSLTCLQKIFSLCSFTCIDDWHPTRSEVSKISIEILLNRCKSILNQFLINENDLGERQMPVVRIEEMIVVLQELGRLVIHPDTASALHLNPHLKEASRNDADYGGRAHVLVLFPLFCELVITREHRVRQSVQVLLRLVASELGLENTTS